MMTDEELTNAMNDVRELMQHHKAGSPFHVKLVSLREYILEEISQNCVREYQKRYGH